MRINNNIKSFFQIIKWIFNRNIMLIDSLILFDDVIESHFIMTMIFILRLSAIMISIKTFNEIT